LSWKQDFIGDIDDDESLNSVIPPSKPPLITNTDSDLVHFITVVSGDVSHDASNFSTNHEGGIKNSLNSNLLSVTDHITDHVLENEDEDIQVKVEKQNIHQISELAIWTNILWRGLFVFYYI